MGILSIAPLLLKEEDIADVYSTTTTIGKKKKKSQCRKTVNKKKNVFFKVKVLLFVSVAG
ncbi:hypothetical protein MTR_7g101340 [Medicago truncatula]|uniref:Uncharacterized protein n=1 Tax=Medicago truncatula TaxID=3880 RepID=G7L2U4_MEDTR|nr:hypothetical protein MTR_7g101340 [Medicago truncatula]